MARTTCGKSRITSYNVCYTKLLRDIDRLGGVDARHDHIRAQDRGQLVSAERVGHRPSYEGLGCKSRITSYNVCYTKLLRASNSVAFAPRICIRATVEIKIPSGYKGKIVEAVSLV